ncbi:hypothetical protein TCON_2032 [Astathelohania contejeani]|uniref:t-SNARE coiled-coil homology domain-containing protein n=1 Tax=Astathelohania contejeani TaxID=164912 RepID=A0ABQ7HXB5_9MICR|nr:hypothetical protein TCON_2032 [Thelohania contejeani]
MNRTEEYFSFIDNSKNKNDDETNKELFYDTMYNSIVVIEKKLNSGLKSYNQVLALEEEYNKLAGEITTVIDGISLEVTSNESDHYEGVKNILRYRLSVLALKLLRLKDKFMYQKIELEPENPVVFKEMPSQELMMEEENKHLTKTYSENALVSTRRRILEIQEIQDTIGLHLAQQNERIDLMIRSSGQTKKNIKGSIRYIDKGGDARKLIRRILFIFLVCISFVLLFIHLFYR